MTAWTRKGFCAAFLFAAVGLGGWAQAAGPVVEVRARAGQTFDASAADQVSQLPQVVKVERFLWVRARPTDVLGVEPGAAIRIPTEAGRLLSAKLESGRHLREADKSAALIGPGIYREDYGFKSPMAGMMHGHPFEPGSSFTFPDSTERVRVVGTFSVEPASEGKRVLLPLATAQRLFGAEGKLTHLFIEIDQSKNLPAVTDAVRRLVGQTADITSR